MIYRGITDQAAARFKQQQRSSSGGAVGSGKGGRELVEEGAGWLR